MPDDLQRHIVNQGPAVDVGGGVKGAVLQALVDHFSDGGLWEGPGGRPPPALRWVSALSSYSEMYKGNH